MKTSPNYPEETEAMDSLIKAAKEDVPNVPEDIFKEHILPQLTRRDGNVDLTFWLEIAGNAYRPLNVVSDSGEFLFQVPSLIRQYDPFTNLSPRESVPERLEVARLKTQVHPQLGEVYYDQEFGKLAQVPPPTPKDVSAWDAILVRYGYPPLTTSPEEIVQVQEKEKLFTGGDEGFDEI